ncbi:MAG: MlaD family protein [Cytophagaceae bacterium]|nr:MlaD family protein [Cytophagaceae bacterium]
MKAAENKRSVVIGIFVLLGVIIFVTGILVLGGQESKFVKHIRLTTVFNNVSGLQVGNNIWFSGVKIGTVRAINFVGASQVEVTMNIEKEAQKYIRRNSMASLGSDGLIGNRLVVISGGSPPEVNVETGDRLQSSTALSSEEIMETLQENNKNLLKVTSDVKGIVAKIVKGEGVAGAVLTDPVLANKFKNVVTDLQTASSRAAKVSNSLADFSAKLNNKGSLANELVTDTSVFRSLKTSMARLNQASASAAETANNVKQTTERLEAKLNARNTPVGMLLNDEETATRLKNTLRNLEGSTVTLEEDLQAVQSNFLFRGYFKKKAKANAKEKEETQKQVSPQP